MRAALRGGSSFAAAASLALLLAPRGARAADDAAAHDGAPHTEPALVPVVGGDNDVGVGAGALGAITRVTPGSKPAYAWRIEAGMLATVKPSPFRFPYQDYYALLTAPHLLHDALRLEVRPSYTRELNQHYYGIGNASADTSPEGPADPGAPYYQYGRTHPTLLVRARVQVTRGLFALVGNTLTYDWLDVSADSKLAHDLAAGPPAVRALLGRTRPHAVDYFEYGVELDLRDDDIVTTRGTWDQIKVRLSPGGDGAELPYRYAQLDAIARGYATIAPRVVLAARAVADVQLGDVPFYELARYEDTFALGGGNGVRGVPGQRYYGKVKLIANLEARATFLDFRLFHKPFSAGAAAFFDAGRAFTELEHAHPDLDGTGLGLKYGVGAGARLQQGKTFVIRLDVAWSPDARPLGAYFAAGEIF